MSQLNLSFAALITESESQLVNFAGHYIFTTWGCGDSECVDGAIIDAKSGDVSRLPRSDFF